MKKFVLVIVMVAHIIIVNKTLKVNEIRYLIANADAITIEHIYNTV